MSDQPIPGVRPSPRGDAQGGTIIADRYRVDKLIARGGMATVYLAHQVNLNRPVALKVLTSPEDPEEARSFEERFRLEGETLAQLDHPHIVTLHDFGELPDDGRFFLAMEYIDGPRLSDLLKDGPLPAERGLPLLVQVCSALKYAHRRGVVHRDLKPSNLLIKKGEDGGDHIKVVDFGLVKLTRDDQSITRAGLILGSPHCMAPEQVRGQDVDPRADIYAIGVLLFRTLTGQYPFHGANSAATMIAHLSQDVPTFYSVAPELAVPAGIEDIVRRCLEKKPDDRYADMGELIDDLSTCVEMPPEAFTSVAQSQSTLRNTELMRQVRPRSHSTVQRGLALLVIAGVIGVVLLAGGLATGAVIGGVLGRGEATPAAAPATIAAPAPVVPEVRAPEPAEVTTDAPQPDVDAERSAEPEPEPEAEPEAEPVTVAPKPRPRPVAPPPPAPEVVAAPPAPTVDAEGEAEEETPEGYMGMPDDLFE